jgi:hypothetical protein
MHFYIQGVIKRVYIYVNIICDTLEKYDMT